VLSRRKLFILFRGFVSVGLLFYLFTMIDWNRFVVLFGQIEKRSLLLAPILLMLGLLFAAIRWYHLLASLRIHQKIRRLYTYYLMGAFYSIFLPGVIGGDIVRIGVCARETKSSVGVITTSVFVERVCGVIILFVMGSLVVFTLPLEFRSALGEPIVKALPAVTTLCLLSLVAAFVIGRRFRDRWFDKKKRSGLVKQLVHILDLVIQLPYSTCTKYFRIIILLFCHNANRVYIHNSTCLHRRFGSQGRNISLSIGQSGCFIFRCCSPLVSHIFQQGRYRFHRGNSPDVLEREEVENPSTAVEKTV